MEIVKYVFGFLAFIGIMAITIGPIFEDIWEDWRK